MEDELLDAHGLADDEQHERHERHEDTLGRLEALLAFAAPTTSASPPPLVGVDVRASLAAAADVPGKALLLNPATVQSTEAMDGAGLKLDI